MASILYVDDEAINLRLFEINFGKTHKVYTAISGETGLCKIKECPEISIVFSDMKMPFLNGLEFIRQTKELRPELPCYLITGYGLSVEIQAAIDAGLVKNYMKKPFVLSEIINAINLSEK